MSRRTVSVALCLLLSGAVVAQDATKPDAQLAGIEEYHLPNGLRVVLARDTSKPTFTLNLTVLVGSIHEGAGEAGMAHVFEHLLFRNLEGFPDVKETLKTLGGQYNGSTSFERTNFYETLSATDENLEAAIKLEGARLGRAHLEAGDLEKEGKIVEGEFDIGQTFPSQLLLYSMLGSMFDYHGYARSPIGTVEDFKSLRIDDIRAFYKKYYRPDNAVLFLTGKFEKEKALGLIDRHFGGLKGTGEGRPRYTTREPGAMGERRTSIRRPGDNPLVAVGYRVPGLGSPQAAAARLLGMMLASEKTGPLHEALVGKELATEVSVVYYGLRSASPFFALAAVVKGRDPDLVEAAMIGMLEKRIDSLKPDDLDRAKGVLEREYDGIFNDSAQLASNLSEYESAGSWKLLLVQRELTKTTSYNDIQLFANRLLRVENRVVGRFIPDAKAMVVVPAPEPPLDTYKDLLAKLPGGTKSAKAFAYTPANLHASMVWVEVGPARIGLLSKEMKGDDVLVQIRIAGPGRDVIAPVLQAGEALAGLMTRRTRDLDKGALSKRLGELKSKIDVGMSLDGTIVVVHSKKENLAQAMAIAREMLRSPSIDADGLRDHVTEKEGELRSMTDNPPLLIQGAAARMIFPEGDPRRIKTAQEQLDGLKTITVEGIQAFHKSSLGADGLIAAVVGEVTREEVEKLFRPLVKDWKAEKPPRIEESTAVEGVTAPLIKVPTPGKPSAFSLILQPFRLRGDTAEATALKAAAWTLFEDPLGSRITKKIREDAALSYATGGQLVLNTDGDLALVLLFTVTKPENAEKAIGMIKAEMESALGQGITAEELASYKKGYLSRAATIRSNDEVLAAMIVQLKKSGLDFRLWETEDERTAALTLEAVNAAMKKYFPLSKAGVIEIGDFK